MTIIVALKDEEKKKIYLGADRQGTAGDIKYANFGCKLLKIEVLLSDGKVDSMHVAISGSSFLHSYLWNVFQAPIFDVEDNFVNYLYKQFFRQLKDELIEQKLIYEENGMLDSEGNIIIVHKDKIYTVYYDLSIVESVRPYVVGGAGQKFALGVIENNLEFHQNMDYRDIIEEALYTTGKLSIYCNTDFDILEIDY